jgi:hypothetical protein
MKGYVASNLNRGLRIRRLGTNRAKGAAAGAVARTAAGTGAGQRSGEWLPTRSSAKQRGG